MHPQILFKQAQEHHQKGNFLQAELGYRALLEKTPHFIDALHLLGIACSQQGKHQEAIAFIQQAIQKKPAYPPYYNNLGKVYAQMQNWEAANKTYQLAVRLAPNFSEAWFNWANLHKATKKMDRAITCYKKTLKYNPKHSKAAYNLGNTLMEIGKVKSSIPWLEKAVALRPNYAEAHNNLGSALEAWKEYDTAAQHYKQAIQLNPQYAPALKNLAGIYERQGDIEQAIPIYQKHFQQKPLDGWEDLQFSQLSPIIFENTQHIHQFQTALLQQLEAYQGQEFPLPLDRLHEYSLYPNSNLIYQGTLNKKIKMVAAKVFAPQLCPPTTAAPSSITQVASTLGPTKPKVGFVVTHGHEGVFIKCMAGLLTKLPTSHFDITIVCNVPSGKAILAPAIKRTDIHFLEIPKEIPLAKKIISEANFSLLHYWEVGTDSLNYFLPFYRLAPIQCTSWGWPTTSGIPNMDYFLSCELLETAEADMHYTEKLVRFKKLPTYYYRPPVPKNPNPLSAYDLPSDKNLYLCAQNLRKVHPDFDTILADIIEQDPKALLLFIEDSTKAISNKLQERLQQVVGDKAAQIRFLPRMTAKEYLGLVAQVAVILDTLYYTGGANTAYDAIAASTPYVTLPSELHRGRFGMAAYRQLGVEDGIATDTTDYVRLAVKIATDTNYRADLKQRIQTNAYRIFEDQEAVLELESFFLQKLNTKD